MIIRSFFSLFPFLLLFLLFLLLLTATAAHQGKVDFYGTLDVYQSDNFKEGIAKTYTVLRVPHFNGSSSYNLDFPPSAGITIRKKVHGVAKGDRAYNVGEDVGKKLGGLIKRGNQEHGETNGDKKTVTEDEYNTVGEDVRKKLNGLTKREKGKIEEEDYSVEEDVISFHHLRSGMVVQVSGTVSGKEEQEGVGMFSVHNMVVDRLTVHSTSVERVGDDDDKEVDYHRAVFLLVNLGKHKIDCTRDYVESSILEGVAGWTTGMIGLFERDSLGTLTFSDDLHADSSPDVFGPFTVDFTNGKCAPDTWANQAEALAVAQGVDINRYQHRVFVLPEVDPLFDACGWHGLGNVGCGLACKVWVGNCDQMEVYLHELGHNLGLRHAGSNWYQGSKFVEYGDPTSVMGNLWWGSQSMDLKYFNGPEMSLLGFLPSNRVLGVTSSGDYVLAPLEEFTENLAAGIPQLIKVAHPIQGYYYFSFRHDPEAPYADQILVHQYYNDSAPTYFIRSLPPDQSFEDNMHQITVAPLYFNTTSEMYVIRIEFGCVVRPTSYALSYDYAGVTYAAYDGNVMVAEKDEYVNLHMEVTNNDSPLCTATTYTIVSLQLPDLWQVTYTRDTLYLIPNQTCLVDISLKFPGVLTDASGFFAPFSFRAVAGSGFSPALHEFSFSGNVSVTSSCVRQDIAVDTLLRDDDEAVTRSLTYDAVITNYDSLSCLPAVFSVSTTVPQNWTYKLHLPDSNPRSSRSKSKSKDLSVPGNVVEFSVDLFPPNLNFAPSDSNLYVTLVVEVDQHAPRTVLILLPHSSQCRRQDPTLTIVDEIYSNITDVEARSAMSILLKVTNNDVGLCEPSMFYPQQSNTINENFVRVSTFPASLLLYPQQFGFVRAIFAAPIVHHSVNVSSSVYVYDDSGRKSKNTDVAVAILLPPCVINPIAFELRCPGQVDSTDSWFICSAGFRDDDVWTCPDITMKMHVVIQQRNGEITNSSTGWYIELEYPTTFPMFSGNLTWMPITFNFPGNVPAGNQGVGIMGGELGNETNHSFKVIQYVQILRPTCRAGSTIFALSPDTNSLWVGEQAIFYVTIRDTDTEGCDPLLFEVSVDGNSDFYGNYSTKISQNQFFVDPQQTKTITITMTANENMNFLGNTIYFTFTVKLESDDDDYDFIHSGSVTGNIVVSKGCTMHNPTIEVYQNFTNTVPGDATFGTYVLTVNNRDVGDKCKSNPFKVDLSVLNANVGNPYSALTLVYADPSSLTLNVPANRSVSQTFKIHSAANTPPNSYPVHVIVSDSRRSVSAQSVYTIECPVPMSVSNLTAIQSTPFLRYRTSIQLQWSACDSPLRCCCPCQWDVYRNGELLTTTSGKNYTDSNRPSGEKASYYVITRDSLGRRSPASGVTCLDTLSLTVDKPNLSSLLIFAGLAIGGVLWLVLLGVLIFMCVRKISDKKEEVVPLLHMTENDDDEE